MIFYFSATGNSRYAAQRLAQATGDTALSVPELLQAGSTAFSVRPGERVGFVFPTYFWGLPVLAENFLRALSLSAPPETYCYFVATCGVMPGAAGASAQALLRRRGVSLSARCSVQMPDTWTPIFDLSDPAKTARQNARADEQLDRIAAIVVSRQRGDFQRRRVPLWFVRAFVRPIFALCRSTSRFSVSDACIGCGLCRQNCPVQAIALRDGKPVWVKARCEICLGCLHRCPQFAIRFGRRTASHGQYRHPPFAGGH
jgi:ferredoxin